MSDGERYQRCLGPAPALEPGQFTVETASGRAAISCKRCGAIAELPETHDVLMGGVVVPRWRCENPKCGASYFLTLCDYHEEVV